MFATSTGRTVGHRNFAKRGVGKAAARAGLTGVTFHALRHTFASLLIDQGHDSVFVSRQLGHANPAITLRVYAHLFDSARHAELARAGLESNLPRPVRMIWRTFTLNAQVIGALAKPQLEVRVCE